MTSSPASQAALTICASTATDPVPVAMHSGGTSRARASRWVSAVTAMSG